MKVVYYGFVVLIALFAICCSKPIDPSHPPIPPSHKLTFSDTFWVNFTLDGVQYSKMYAKDTANPPDGLDYYPTGDQYEARGAKYYLQNPKQYISILVGFGHGILSKDFAGAYQSFKSNFSPGNKTYRNILYPPQPGTNLAEIAYQDEQGNDWSTTWYKTDSTTGFTATTNQPTGKFTITEVKEMKDERDKDGLLIVKGTFNCKLFAVNGTGIKDIQNGSFVGLVRL